MSCLSRNASNRQSSSVRALQLIQANPNKFSLLITDQTMPRLTGLGLIDEVRRSHPGLPVILCSGFSEAIETEKVAQLGICYLSKPTDPDNLLVAAGNLLSVPVQPVSSGRTLTASWLIRHTSKSAF